MPPRSQRSAKERDARSRTVKRVADQEMLRGSLVQMLRTCGKSGCRCQQGDKHPALYLAIKSGGKRSMVYIPRELEDVVRQWVQNARQIEQGLELVSEHCYQRLLQRKEQVLARKGRRESRGKAKRKGKSP